jgi:hypothetical protein
MRALLLPLALLVGAGFPQCDERPRPASGEAARSYLPLVEGARWRYAISTQRGGLEVEVMGRGERDLARAGRRIFVMDERNLGPSLGFDAVAPVGYVVEHGYVARIEGIGYDRQGGLRELGQDAPTRLLPIDPKPGDSWEQSNHLFGTPEDRGANLAWRATISGRSDVTVPAGAFADVIEVVTTYYDDDPTIGPAPKVVYRDYYARGIGLVKSVTEDPSGDASNRIEQLLVDYSFP